MNTNYRHKEVILSPEGKIIIHSDYGIITSDNNDPEQRIPIRGEYTIDEESVQRLLLSHDKGFLVTKSYCRCEPFKSIPKDVVYTSDEKFAKVIEELDLFEEKRDKEFEEKKTKLERALSGAHEVNNKLSKTYKDGIKYYEEQVAKTRRMRKWLFAIAISSLLVMLINILNINA